MIASLRQMARATAPEPLRLAMALARRTLADCWSNERRRMARRAAPASNAQQPRFSFRIAQEIKRSAFWEGKLANIRRGAARLDGVALAPGEIFSFWRLIGQPSVAAGYAVGRSIRNGHVGGDVGGRLCQLSGIAYEVGLRVGLEVLERTRTRATSIPWKRRLHVRSNWLPRSGETDDFSYDIPLPYGTRRRAKAADGTLRPPQLRRTRKQTYKDRAVDLARSQPIITPDDLGGVCVYRCQLRKLCDLGLLERVAYGRYRLGPAAVILVSDPDDLAA